MGNKKKEEGKMKTLTLAALFLIVLSAGAGSHVGSIGLYTTEEAIDCDMTFTAFLPSDIYVMYFKSTSGPDGISGAQFRIEMPASGTVHFQGFETHPNIILTTGDIVGDGISVSYAGCTGTGLDLLLIGKLTVFPMATGDYTFKVLSSLDIHPNDPPFEPRVARCDLDKTLAGLLGGWFSTPDGSCNVGTEEKTWGAIKEMYKD